MALRSSVRIVSPWWYPTGCCSRYATRQGYSCAPIIYSHPRNLKTVCSSYPRTFTSSCFVRTLSGVYRGEPTHQNSILFTPIARLSDYPPHNLVKLPSLSPTMETGTVVSWAKNEGDEVNEGDLLAEIETDKATMSFDANDSGILAKILVSSGTRDIPVGTPLCIIVQDPGSVAAFKEYVASAAPPTPAAKAAPETPAPPATPAPPTAPTVPTLGTPKPATGDRVFISPLARRLAAEQGIDINQLSGLGTGIRGMVRAADLANARPSAAAVSAATAMAGSFVDIPTSGLRAVIASRLTESNQTIPHYYLTTDIIMDDVLELRQDINAKLAKRSVKAEDAVKVTVNDIIIKAIAATCRKVPECNSSWQGDFIRQFNTVDVNVAVATSQGLITPIVYGADSKGLVEINQEVRALAAKAKENKLQLHEFQGGTFTVSNLGMFGISSFCAIISPPQACLLAVGNTQQQIFPDENTSSGFRKRQVMSVTLCCDHRVVDGAVGAQWLAEFKSLLENPALMLV
ncbi:hypothetical protein CRM22_004686 [Opisthorchis felineus]|uniref:Acetyltransferase component of pyruvate dehydrogenase complex n=1 Tax=Opisthorchis felineus TaxID=147828 RepID=A0A4S2M186_OPIFE|nr:hypothetical protein CRM22_004686 [Opisthorchis felineus]